MERSREGKEGGREGEGGKEGGEERERRGGERKERRYKWLTTTVTVVCATLTVSM